jgi:hypothetical protein
VHKPDRVTFAALAVVGMAIDQTHDLMSETAEVLAVVESLSIISPSNLNPYDVALRYVTERLAAVQAGAMPKDAES